MSPEERKGRLISIISGAPEPKERKRERNVRREGPDRDNIKAPLPSVTNSPTMGHQLILSGPVPFVTLFLFFYIY